jgi:hypothetical protein
MEVPCPDKDTLARPQLQLTGKFWWDQGFER